MHPLHEIKKKGSPDETAKKKDKARPGRSRVPVVPAIKVALARHGYGFIFTTPQADDYYVITHGTWGEKSANKVVKSFPPGTSYEELKGYSERTKAKHGAKKPGKEAKGKVEQEKAAAGYATKKNPKKED
jgi:hypothetical protein